MNKKWADEYSSDEGEQDVHEDDQVSEDEKVEAVANATASLVVEAPAPSDAPAFVADITGISYSATRQQLGEYFESLGCDLCALDLIMNDHDGRFSGNAVIQFTNEESMKRCLAASGNEFAGRKIRTLVHDDHHPRGGRGGGGGGRGGYNRDRPHQSREGGHERGQYHPRDRDVRDNRGYRDSRDSRDNRDNRDNRDHRDNRDSRDHRDGGGRRSNDVRNYNRPAGEQHQPRPAAPPAPPAEKAEPAVRPKLNLLPRSVPKEDAAPAATAKSSIFGEGHARDSTVHDRKKPEAVPAAAAPQPAKATEAASTGLVTTAPADVPPPAPEGGAAGSKPAARERPQQGNRREREKGGRGERPARPATAEGEAPAAGEAGATAAERPAKDRSGNQSARLFNNAMQQTGKRTNKSAKPAEKEEPARPVELTDEEKFKRAQVTMAKADKSSSAANAVKKKTGGFDVLGGSDDEDD